VGGVLAQDTVIATAAEKAALHRASNALAVDMESARAAVAAARARVPFVILRAIADPATRDLPPAARIPLRPNGSANLAAVLSSLVREPGQIPSLMRLTTETTAALWALGRAGRALGPVLRAP
jgi:adenosylhomocysteine nucleosidase